MNKNINLNMNIEDLRKKYWLLKIIVVNEKETWLWYDDRIHLYWSSFHILWCIIDYYWLKLCFDIISIKFVLEKNSFDNDDRNFWFYNDNLMLKVRMTSWNTSFFILNWKYSHKTDLFHLFDYLFSFWTILKRFYW